VSVPDALGFRFLSPRLACCLASLASWRFKTVVVVTRIPAVVVLRVFVSPWFNALEQL